MAFWTSPMETVPLPSQSPGNVVPEGSTEMVPDLSQVTSPMTALKDQENMPSNV